MKKVTIQFTIDKPVRESDEAAFKALLDLMETITEASFSKLNPKVTKIEFEG